MHTHMRQHWPVALNVVVYVGILLLNAGFWITLGAFVTQALAGAEAR